jgi:hypothetical protein
MSDVNMFLSDAILRSHLLQGVIHDVKDKFPALSTSVPYEIILSISGVKYYTPWSSVGRDLNKTWVTQNMTRRFLEALRCPDEEVVYWILKYGEELPREFPQFQI